ncbi:MAG: hypothetical protein PVSMB3_13640 [Candidatus Dormibacteraceae bacterium]
MDLTPGQAVRGLWAFWIACALCALGAFAPFLLSAGSNRVNGALIPFVLAAVLFAACARLHNQGKPITTALYFVACLAIVYGLLSLLALPLRLSMLGTCPGTGTCPIGLERPLTTGERTAVGFAIGMGIVAILTGFFGLRTLYHRHRSRQAAAPSTPPTRSIPPVGARSESPATAAVKPSEGSVTVAEGPPQSETEPPAELPAHEPDLELPAHSTENVRPGGPPAGSLAPQPQPGRQRMPKVPTDPPTETP